MSREIPSGGNVATSLSGSGSYTKLFKTGVRYIRPRAQMLYQFKVLPAFNPAIDRNTPAGKVGYAPYRDAEGQFSKFIARVSVNRAIGPRSMDFLSPKTFGSSEIDPIEILYQTAKNNPQYVHLTQRGNTKPPQLQPPSDFGLMNVFEPKKPEAGVQLCMLPKSGFDDMLEKLNLTPDPSMPHVPGPYGDKFQWGDITDPVHGLLMNVYFEKDAKSGFSYYKVSFQQFPGPQGVSTRYCYPLQGDFGNQVLAARYYMQEAVQVLSSAEVIEYLCTVFPRPLMELALGQMFQLPAAHPGTVYSQPPAQPQGGGYPAPTPPWQQPQQPVQQWQQPAPAQPQAQPLPPWQQPAPAQPQPQAPTQPVQQWQQPAPVQSQQPQQPVQQWQQPAPVQPQQSAQSTPPWQQPAQAPAAQTPPWQQPAPAQPQPQAPMQTQQQWQPPAQPSVAPSFQPAQQQPVQYQQPPQQPSAPAPASSLPVPGSLPPPQQPPQQPPQGAAPGGAALAQGPDGLWDGFSTKELAMEYHTLINAIKMAPDTMKDPANVKRMTELMTMRKTS